ncbi:uncharacterized protein FIBRA_04484 [Fibroporia radiculosa]|uniref:Uncharacterized protein n=1 Tax=Fibroporia radiculosa TaxID=599839 RepID=J4G7G6_9APHY|nr:uncharacterized protein FIBRA_04484 [Fibroporia radiculosa]CCM02388.1 predicted protein [Fibroporia radiculosa]
MTTIHNIPPEVLKTIFEHATTYVDKEKCQELADRVISVCQRWKTVGLETPALWATIYVTLDYDHSDYGFIQTSLARSGHHKLDINLWILHSHLPSNGSVESWISKVMELLLPHMKRWKSLYMYVSLSDLAAIATASWTGTAVALQALQIESSGADQGIPDVCSFSLPATFSAPNLRLYSLQSMDCVEVQDAINMPKAFPALRILRICRRTFKWIDTMEMMQLLHHLPSLQLLSLDGPMLDQEDPDPADAIENPPCLRALRELEFTFVGAYDVATSLRAFDAPLLEKLTIGGCHSEDLSEGLMRIEAQLARFPSLHILNHGHNHYNGEQTFSMKQTCTCFSTFRQFDLGDVSLLDVLSCLAKEQPEGWYLPTLTSLELRSGREHATSYVGLLRDLVEARQGAQLATGEASATRHPLALEEITVHAWCDISEEERSWFKERLQTFKWDPDLSEDRQMPSSVAMCCAPARK